MESIVCFFADGSDKYTPMTAYALRSFLKTTPKITCALFTHSEETRDRVLSEIPAEYHDRIVHKFANPEPWLRDWNPTQYKLDLVQLVDAGYETIFWVDSDVIVFDDMTSFIMDFVRSKASVLVVPDHVMHDFAFLARWRQQHEDTIIPQACLMGFRASVVEELFAVWREEWSNWISPWPFQKYQDPRPDFQGSAFCTEQYALGNALRKTFFARHQLEKPDQPFSLFEYIKIFQRELVIIDQFGNALTTRPNDPDVQTVGMHLRTTSTGSLGAFDVGEQAAFNAANSSASFDLSRLSLSGSFPGFNYSGYSGSTAYSGLSGYSGVTSFSGLQQFSGLTSFSGLSGFSGLENFSGLSSFSGLSGFSGVSNFSGVTSFSGLENFSGLSSFSGLSGFSGVTSFSGVSGYSGLTSFSGLRGFSGAAGFSGFSGSHPEGYSGPSASGSFSGNFSGYSGAQSSGSIFAMPGFFIIDRFGAGPTSSASFYHTYSQFYPQARSWFDAQV